MSQGDWYRNESWNDSVEEQFMSKLKRARNKEQYLRIQASYLAENYPSVSLRLLDQYFLLEDDFDHAQAYCDKATALIALGEFEKAVQAYRAALAREEEFPNLKTNAYLDFPALVVKIESFEHYEEALEVLNINYERLIFPVDVFRWHTIAALIESRAGNARSASEHACKALEAAQVKKSGFRFHQKVGLVGEENSWLVAKAQKLCA